MGRSFAVWASALLLVWDPFKSAHAALLPVAPLSDTVMDQAALMSRAEQVQTRHRLADLQRTRGIQFVVVTLQSLSDEDIEGCALRHAEAYKLGQKGRDDGVLLLVARAEKQVRFEVGYGLEGALPDVAARRLIDKVHQAHPQGIDGSVVVALVSEASDWLEQHAPPAAQRRDLAEPLIEPAWGLGLAAVGVALALGWFTLGRRRLDAQPFQPLRPIQRPQAGHAGTFRDSLWYSVLLGWLFSGRGRRGGPRGGGSDGGPPSPRGGGGGFGGGGASGRW